MDRATRSACWMARIISGRIDPTQRTTGASSPQRRPIPRNALAVPQEDEVVMEAGDEGDGRGARRPQTVGHMEGGGQGPDESLRVGGDAGDEDECDERTDAGTSCHRVTQVVEARTQSPGGGFRY